MLAEYPSAVFKIRSVSLDFKIEKYFPNSICSRIGIIPFIKDRVKLREAYKSMSVFILPSLYEGFGLVEAEAKACGCAVIMSKVGLGASLKMKKKPLFFRNMYYRNYMRPLGDF